MSWKKVQIKTPITDDTAQVIQQGADVATNVATVFGTITTALKAVQAFLVNTFDPFLALVDSIIVKIEQTTNDLFGTGFYLLVIDPQDLSNSAGLISINEQRTALSKEEDEANTGFKIAEQALNAAMYNANPSEQVKIKAQLAEIQNQRELKRNSLNNQRAQLELTRADYGFDSFGWPILSPRNCILAAVESLDDVGDSNRPQFSDTAYISAIGFMVSSLTIEDFKTAIEDFLKVIEIPEWRAMLDRIIEISTVQRTIPASVNPDWKSARLNQLSPFDGLQKGLISLLETTRGVKINASGSLNDLINIMQTRTDNINKLANDLQKIVDSITFTSGVYTLNVPAGPGGINRLKSELRDTFLECQTNKYSAMVLIVGGGASNGGSVELVDKLRALLFG